MLRGHVPDEALEPGVEGVPRIGVVERGGRAADLLDLVDVERLDQSLPVREVAVERADPDARAARDLLERRRLTTLGERVARGREHLLVVAQRIRALGAGEERGGGLV